MVSPFSNQRQVMEKVQGLQANVTKTLLELKTNATAKLKALKDNVDRRMAQSLVVSLALFNANGGASSMGMTASADGSMIGSATIADRSSSKGDIGVDKNITGSNVSRGGGNDGDSGAGGGLGKTSGSTISGERNRKGSNDGDSEAGGGLGKTTGIMISGEGNRNGSNDGDSGAGGGLGKTTGSMISGEGNRNGSNDGDSGAGGGGLGKTSGSTISGEGNRQGSNDGGSGSGGGLGKTTGSALSGEGNRNGGSNSNNDGRTGGNASSRATGDAGPAGQSTPPREFINGDIRRSGEAISNLQSNNANSSTGDENPSRNLAGTSQNSSKNGNQTIPDYKVMPLQDQREGSGLQRPKRFRRQAPVTGKTERPSASRGEESLLSPKETAPVTGKTERPAASRGEESLVSPKETLRSSLVLPTDDMVSVPTPAVMRAAAVQPEVGADVAGGLKANLADLEFLLQSYRIDAEELLINRHLLTATSDMNAFFMQIDNIAKGEVTPCSC